MSDFDDLKRALEDATPPPDAARKQENLARALEHFDDLQFSRQGNATGARLTSEHPKTGLLRGVRNMIAHFSTKGLLTASTALAAFGLVVFLPVLQDSMQNGSDVLTTEQSEPVGGLLSSDAVDAPVIAAEELAPVDRMAPPKPTLLPAPTVAAEGRARSEAMDQGVQYLTAPSAAKMTAPTRDIMPVPQADTEEFSEAEANPLKVTVEEPVSTFSIDVDTASWSILRNSLTYGNLPPEGAVRIEEMVNYFTYDYPAPEGGAPFKPSVGVTQTPWNTGTQIVHIGLQGAMPAARPAMNLVFLIDTSGSMDQPNKLPLLKQSFRLMLGQLSEDDSVSIVTYAGSAGRVLDPTPASDRDTILAALDNLHAGGGTAGQAGLQQAYATAKEMSQEGEVSRVILATDGDFNIGIHDPEELETYIAKERESGTYLSVLGFGRGNLDDATMQALAQTGNGMASYIDTLAEAQKVLVDQLTGALVPIADDVKIQVEFNPALVAEYRLIGYETRALKREDFNNDKVDAGEIGAGHQVTALYEITPVGSQARLTDPLRYGAAPEITDSNELGFLRLRYKAPGESDSHLIETPIEADTAPLPDAGFALAIAGFGQILRGSTLIGDWSFGDAIELAQGAKGTDPYGYRQEAVTLMRLAQSLSQ